MGLQIWNICSCLPRKYNTTAPSGKDTNLVHTAPVDTAPQQPTHSAEPTTQAGGQGQWTQENKSDSARKQKLETQYHRDHEKGQHLPSLFEALDSSLATQEKNEKRVKSRHVAPVPLLRSNQLREMYFYKRQKKKNVKIPQKAPSSHCQLQSLSSGNGL